MEATAVKPDDPPWLPTLAEEVAWDRRWEREYETETETETDEA